MMDRYQSEISDIAHTALNNQLKESWLHTNVFFRLMLETGTAFNRMAVCPANIYGLDIVLYCRRFNIPEPILLDDNIERDDMDIRKIGVSLEGVHLICIMTYTIEDLLFEKLKMHYPHIRILRYGAPLLHQRTMLNVPLKNILNFVKLHQNSPYTGHLAEMASSETVLVFGYNQFSDTDEKIRAIQKDIPCSIIRISDDGRAPEMRDGVIYAEKLTVYAFMLKYRRIKNLIYYQPTFYKDYAFAFLIKRFSVAKTIIYITDRLQSYCRYENRDILEKYSGINSRLLGYEYMLADAALKHRADIYDGVIYRDADFELFAGCACPKLHFPAYPSEANFQDSIPESLLKIVNIGVILSIDHDPEVLWSKTYMYDCLSHFYKYGFSIDFYVPASYLNRAESYKRYIKEELENTGSYTFYEGKPIHTLLPEIKNRYAWGLCSNNRYGTDVNDLEKRALPAKLFNYIALGVPIIVYKSMEAAAEYVRTAGIGIVADDDAPAQALISVKHEEYEKMRQRLLEFRSQNSFEKHIKVYCSFIKSVIDN